MERPKNLPRYTVGPIDLSDASPESLFVLHEGLVEVIVYFVLAGQSDDAAAAADELWRIVEFGAAKAAACDCDACLAERSTKEALARIGGAAKAEVDAAKPAPRAPDGGYLN